MDSISILAAGGMRARMDALDLLANNIANASTPGYKADREFYDLFVSAEAMAGDQGPANVTDVCRKWTDLSQGTMLATSNPLDLAIAGKGFFQCDAPEGTLLTRNGSFRVNAAGELTTEAGYPVRGSDGRRIRVDPLRTFEIGRDGTVNQGGIAVGQIALGDVASVDALEKRAGGYFRLADTAAITKAAAGTEIQQGKLEAANVSSAESAVRLINVMRQFEMLQKAIGIGGEMNRKAVEEVAKVSS